MIKAKKEIGKWILGVLVTLYVLYFIVIRNQNVESEIWKYIQEFNPNLPTDYSPSTQARAKTTFNRTMTNFIIKQLSGKKNGFFVECGAFDGEWLSNTLLLERDYNWTGLLIEADPKIQPILKARNRHAFVATACLSLVSYPTEVEFRSDVGVRGISYIDNEVVFEARKDMGKSFETRFRVKCFPLNMFLDAVERKEVDYLSLDMEGVELDVLKTIDWKRTRIKLISVEVTTEIIASLLESYMKSVGYKKIGHLKERKEYLNDHVYELIE